VDPGIGKNDFDPVFGDHLFPREALFDLFQPLCDLELTVTVDLALDHDVLGEAFS